jgi:hypothetical protein
VEHTITDPAKFEEYRIQVGPMIAKHGGHYLTKGGTHQLLETDRRPPDREGAAAHDQQSAWVPMCWRGTNELGFEALTRSLLRLDAISMSDANEAAIA